MHHPQTTPSRSSTAGAGTLVSLPTLLSVLFIILKLAGVIGWPWLIVLAPLILPFFVVIVVILFIVLLQVAHLVMVWRR